jgi:hypothetical protein
MGLHGYPPSVHYDFFWLQLYSQNGNAGTFESAGFTGDVRVVVRCCKRLALLPERRFQLSQLLRKIGCLEYPFAAMNEAVSRVVQIEIRPRNSMLVEIDSVHPPHEHESYAARAPDLYFQWLPIRFHLVSRLL